MARLNTRPTSIHTHEGAKAKHVSAGLQLQRTVMACMLWEREFYEDGQTVAQRIAALVPQVNAEHCRDVAIAAREESKLRHVPLLIAAEMVKHDTHKGLVADLLTRIIKRPDELTEFLAIYWREGKTPLAAQVKKGLARAFCKFDAHRLAKYDRPGDIRLRDVLFLTHPRPTEMWHEQVWKQLVDGTLAVPDTWEVALSKDDGIEKSVKWTRLLQERKLGALALIRNLRNMREAGVPQSQIIPALAEADVSWVLPFRFIAAARHNPSFEHYLGLKMIEAAQALPKLYGQTSVLVDVSGSMTWALSKQSDMTRLDAACGVAIIAREMCDNVRVFTFSNHGVEVPPRNGFALADAIRSSQPHGGTRLGAAVRGLEDEVEMDRLIVITDEQSHDPVPDPKTRKAYMINVASNRNGVGYGAWTHVDGFSEAVMNFIAALESED